MHCLFSLGQERRAGTMLSPLVNAVSEAADVTGHTAAPQGLDKCQMCRQENSSYDLVGLSGGMNVAFWFRQSGPGCVSKQGLYDFTADPPLITVFPPHPGDCNSPGAMLVCERMGEKSVSPPYRLHQLS